MTFLSDAYQQIVLDLPRETGRIRAIAACLVGRVSPGDAVGVLGQTGPELVLNWLGALLSGARPLILQYPTKKQSRTYWTASVANTTELVGLTAILCEDALIPACPGDVNKIPFPSSRRRPWARTRLS